LLLRALAQSALRLGDLPRWIPWDSIGYASWVFNHGYSTFGIIQHYSTLINHGILDESMLFVEALFGLLGHFWGETWEYHICFEEDFVWGDVWELFVFFSDFDF
jgi:hypothetical protein